MKKKLSKYHKWAKKYPEKAAAHNAARRKRTDRRDRHGIWGVRLRLIMLHTGQFHDRLRDQYYEGVEVRLTILELAKLWFRDAAWTMKDPHCDRIDPDGHYEFNNCRFIEGKANLERRHAESGAERQPGEEG